MPIRIEHEPPASMLALAGLMTGTGRAATTERGTEREEHQAQLQRSAQIAQTAMGIGARRDMQVKQLEAQRAAQMRQIEAQADRQKEAADTAYQRTALAAGLQEKIQEKQFDNQMEKMQEAARIQASQWEYQYTTQQRQEIAKLNEIDQLVETDPKYADIRDQWRVMSLQQRAGIRPGALPADPNKPVYKPGRAPGDEFQDQGGNWHMVQPDGTSKMTLRWDQGPEAAKMKYEAEREAAAATAREKFRDKIATERASIAGTLIEDEKGMKRYPTPAEVWKQLQTAYPVSTWPEREAGGPEMEHGPTDAQLEEARNLLREMRAKRDRGEGLFPDEILAVQQAGRLLRGSVAGGGP